MDKAVTNRHSEPLLVQTSLKERFTVIAVDPQIRTPNGETYDVIFVGTSRGRVLKFISAVNVNDIHRQTNKPVIVEEMQIFPYHVPVTNLQVVRVRDTNEGRLVVLSDHEVKSLPLNRCNAVQVQNCNACVALQDPYCAWNVHTNSCVDHSKDDADLSSFVQDVFNGKHVGCSADGAGKIISWFILIRVFWTTRFIIRNICRPCYMFYLNLTICYLKEKAI